MTTPAELVEADVVGRRGEYASPGGRLRAPMRARAMVLGLGVLAAASGCRATLHQVMTQPKADLASSMRCTSGPLELSTTWEGSRWGEYLTLRVRSPRALTGWAVVTVDGKPYGAPRRWHTGTDQPSRDGTTYVADRAPANQRCLERPSESAPAWAAAPAPDGTPAPGVAPAPDVAPALEPAPWPRPAVVVNAGPRSATVGVSVAVPVPAPDLEPLPWPAPVAAPTSAAPPVAGAAPPEVTEVAWVPETPALVTSKGVGGGPHFGLVLDVSERAESRDRPAPWPAGARVVVQLYSEAPNDYEGAVFTFEQGAWKPGDDAAWEAELDRREADARRDAHYRTWDSRRAAEARAREAKARFEHCAAHPDDAECRPPPPVRQSTASRRETVAVVPVATAPEAPKPHAPAGPPPPTPLETPPPAPASYVQWVSGTWTWSGFEWVWLGGWWKVDEARRAAIERQASRPCPAPRAEAVPAPPVAGASWQVGVWVWSATSWVWLPGGWRAAPEVHRAVPASRR